MVFLGHYDEDGDSCLLALLYGAMMDEDTQWVGDEGVTRSKKGVYISLEMQTLFFAKRIA